MSLAFLLLFSCSQRISPAEPVAPQVKPINRSCIEVCRPDFWECVCAFELKESLAQPCREEFVQDHDSDCNGLTISQCLDVVIRAAEVRQDSELVAATQQARQCVVD